MGVEQKEFGQVYKKWSKKWIFKNRQKWVQEDN